MNNILGKFILIVLSFPLFLVAGPVIALAFAASKLLDERGEAFDYIFWPAVFVKKLLSLFEFDY